MKNRLLKAKIFIKDHLGKEVKTPVLFVNGEPHPEGLLSSEIFGRSIEENRVLSGYIQLPKHYLQPIVYEGYFKRRYRNIDNIIQGTKKYSIDRDGSLIEDENGNTGIDWLYENFDSIKFKNLEENEEDRILTRGLKKSLKRMKRENIFTDKIIVIPIIYRDVNMINGTVRLDELNTLYQKLLSLCQIYKNNINNPLVSKFSIDMNMQLTLVSIEDYWKNKIFGKDGLQRRKTMGRTVDLAARVIISAPFFKGHFGSSPIDLDRSGFPLSVVLSTFQPMMIYYARNLLFEFYNKGYIQGISREELDETFNRKSIRDLMKLYIDSWGDRLKKIELPNGDILKIPVTYVKNGEEVTEEREITLTEFFYIATYNGIEIKDNIEVISRYPIMDMNNIVVTKVHVLSTIETSVVTIDGFTYKYYPDLFSFDFNRMKEDLDVDISTVFHETVKCSNTYLKGFDGDYDGDKIAIRSLMSEEAKEEAISLLNTKLSVISLDGDIIKWVGGEAMQTLYSLTVPKNKTSKMVKGDIVRKLLNATPEMLTPDFIFNDLQMGRTTKRETYYKHNDIVVLEKGDYPGITTMTETTLGILLVNKVIFSVVNYPYINETLNGKTFMKHVDAIRDLMVDDELSLDTFKHFIKVYEDFSFRMTSFINPSLDSSVLVPTKRFAEERERLFKEHAEDLKNNNLEVANMIEKRLIEIAKEEYKGKDYLEWYDSGSMGKMGYDKDFKVANIMIGGVPRIGKTGEYYVSTSNYVEGTKKNEMHIFAEQLISAAAARAKDTAIGGYLAKQAVAIFQTLRQNVYGSDCGSKNGIVVEVNEATISKLLVGRYTVSNEVLTKKILKTLIGKKIRIRSPEYCKHEIICSHCGGERVYNIYGRKDQVINIGLQVPKILTELAQASLQKTHGMGANIKKIDMNDWIKEINE